MIREHPSIDIVGTSGAELSGKQIALCVTGSVAILRAPDIARSLMRRGAQVRSVMTEAAQQLMGADLLHWATGQEPVTSISGEIEHVALAGNVEGKVDLVLVAPCTANTLGKIAAGIDDTPVTTTVTTAIGEGIPVLIVPAMHEPMYRHPIVGENIDKLKGHGIRVLAPEVAEGKAKIPAVDSIVREVIETLRPAGPLQGKSVLITAGRTVEYIDPIRLLTNNSSGKMGMAIARCAVEAGASVTVVYGKGTAEPATGARILSVDTSQAMKDAVLDELTNLSYDVMIAAAAVGDWKPKQQSAEKISTHHNESLTLELIPTPKIIDEVKHRAPGVYLVAFRALHALSEKELIENAFQRMNKARADMIAVNDVSKAGAGFETDTNELYLIDRERSIEHIPMTTKLEAAKRLIDVVAHRIS